MAHGPPPADAGAPPEGPRDPVGHLPGIGPELRDVVHERSLRSTMEAIRRACHADRASLARLDDGARTFVIAAESGRPLMNPGVGFPVELSTMIASGADGAFGSPDFARDRRWVRPLDSLMLGMGFSSGVSLALEVDDHIHGVLSLSSNRLIDLDRAAQTAATYLPRLADRARRAWTEAPVLICDDLVFARPMRNLLEHEFGRTVVQVPSVDTVIGYLRSQSVRLIVLGPAIRSTSWAAACALIRSVAPDPPIILHSHGDSMRERRAARECAVEGYLAQGSSEAEANAVIATVLGGGRSLPDVHGAAQLTPREVELLRCLEHGHSFQLASEHLGITLTTAKSYGRSLYSKLEAGTKTSAIRRARELGWL